MLLLTSIPLQHQATGDYFVHVQLLVGSCSMLHVLNVYLPPHLPHVADAWQSILDAVDSLPHTDPLVLVGDLNTHIQLPHTEHCTLHGCQKTQLTTSLCPCGKLILASLQECNYTILNGCPNTQTHSFICPSG